jgi:hypothetical protein
MMAVSKHRDIAGHFCEAASSRFFAKLHTICWFQSANRRNCRTGLKAKKYRFVLTALVMMTGSDGASSYPACTSYS